MGNSRWEVSGLKIKEFFYGYKIPGRDIKKLNEADNDQLVEDPFLILSDRNSIAAIQFLRKKIKEIEKA
jgi:hypothetical protein